MAEPVAAGDELLLLRLRPPLVPHADPVVDLDRLLGRAADGGRSGLAGSITCGSASPRTWGCWGSSSTSTSLPPTSARCLRPSASALSPPVLTVHAAGRHLVLHLPGPQLHRGRLSRHPAGAAELRGRCHVRGAASRSSWPARSSGPRTCCRRSRARAGSRWRQRARDCCSSRWGYFKKLVIADTVGITANKVFSLEAPSFYLLWAGVLRLRPPDLRRLLGVQRHRARHGAVARLRSDAELRSARTSRAGRATSGRAGTSRSRPGSATTCTCRSAARAAGSHASSATSCSPSCSRGCGTGQAGTTSSGAPTTGCCSSAAGSPPASSPTPAGALATALVPLRIAATFLLVHVGWLMFRETDTQMLLRHLSLTPWESSTLDRQAGAALVLMLLPFAAPLYRAGRVGRVVAPPARPVRRSSAPTGSPRGMAGVSGRARGAAARRHAAVPQPRVPRLHLLPVLRA